MSAGASGLCSVYFDGELTASSEKPRGSSEFIIPSSVFVVSDINSVSDGTDKFGSESFTNKYLISTSSASAALLLVMTRTLKKSGIFSPVYFEAAVTAPSISMWDASDSLNIYC